MSDEICDKIAFISIPTRQRRTSLTKCCKTTAPSECFDRIHAGQKERMGRPGDGLRFQSRLHRHRRFNEPELEKLSLSSSKRLTSTVEIGVGQLGWRLNSESFDSLAPAYFGLSA